MGNKMTAQELIYKMFLVKASSVNENINEIIAETQACESFEDIFDELLDSEFSDDLYEVRYDCRYGDQVVLDLEPKTSSRHYEIEVRASKIDGVWVAWDFYYGGGKHGEPEAFDWISNARIVDCEERVATKTEYVFKERT